MENLIQWYLDNLNYFTITILMAIESSFIPLPSEFIVPPAAYKAAAGEQLNIYLVVFFATVGANIGALFNYFLARYLGRPLVYKFANSRIGHMCMVNQAKVEKSERFFDKYGATATFIGRLLPAVRHLISIPAGLVRMKLSTFILYTTLGAFLWNIILAAMGYYMSKIPGIETEEQLIEQVTKYSSEIGYIIIGLAIIVVAFIAYHALKKKKQHIN